MTEWTKFLLQPNSIDTSTELAFTIHHDICWGPQKGRGCSSLSHPGLFLQLGKEVVNLDDKVGGFSKAAHKSCETKARAYKVPDPQISSSKCVTATEPRRAMCPRKEFPWFCPSRIFLHTNKVSQPSTGLPHCCRNLKQMLRTHKHLQPSWRTQHQWAQAGHWDRKTIYNMQTFCLPRYKTFWKYPTKQRPWSCADLHHMKMGPLKINSRWAVWSCPEVAC